MIDTLTKKMIEDNPCAFATVDDSGRPNVIAVAYVKVVSMSQVLITDNCMKQTKDNLEKNNNVCLAVWNKKWNGVKLVGKAEYFTSGKWKTCVQNLTENKGLPAKGAILVTVSELIKLK